MLRGTEGEEDEEEEEEEGVRVVMIGEDAEE